MISIRHVSKRYASTNVLDDISLEIPQDAYVALLGPSGSGKSTLLRCIAGLVTPDAGRIDPFGDLPPEKRNLGMVFQSYAVWPHMSVLKNVAYRVPEVAARAALERVGLAAFAERAPGTLSGGQQQRVALARALAMNPRALLLDEPLANLDPHLRADLCDELRRLRGQRTFIHVTHDREEALGLATQLVVLKDGRVEQTGTPGEVYLHPKTAFVAEFVAGAVRVGREHIAQLEQGDEFHAEVMSVAYAGTHYNCTVRIEDAVTRVRLDAMPGATIRLTPKLRWTFARDAS